MKPINDVKGSCRKSIQKLRLNLGDVLTNKYLASVIKFIKKKYILLKFNQTAHFFQNCKGSATVFISSKSVFVSSLALEVAEL